MCAMQRKNGLTSFPIEFGEWPSLKPDKVAKICPNQKQSPLVIIID